MKTILMYVAGAITFLLFLLGMMWVMRAMSNAVTTVVVDEVRPGVECAKMVTADGAAIDCWIVSEIGK